MGWRGDIGGFGRRKMGCIGVCEGRGSGIEGRVEEWGRIVNEEVGERGEKVGGDENIGVE